MGAVAVEYSPLLRRRRCCTAWPPAVCTATLAFLCVCCFLCALGRSQPFWQLRGASSGRWPAAAFRANAQRRRLDGPRTRVTLSLWPSDACRELAALVFVGTS